MRTFDLNLSSRPFRNNTLLWLSALLAILVLTSLSFWNVRTYTKHQTLASDLRGQVSSYENEAAELDRRGQTAYDGIYATDVSLIEVQADKANEFIRWKAFSWTRLFNQMQVIQPHSVQMTSIRPVFRKKRLGRRTEKVENAAESVPVTVEGLAKTLQDFFEFERALMSDPHFSRIEPEATATDENSRETVFSLRFLYTPDPERQAEGDQAGPATGDGGDVRAAASLTRDGRAG